MIYLVEDDAAIRELEQYALQSSGYEVSSFESAEPFWQAMHAAEPELVILDVMLPGEDGFSILKKLRNTPSLRKLPIIMVTAKSSELDTVRGLDCGADDFEAEDDVFTVYTDPDDFNAVADAMTQKGYSFVSAQIEMVPQNYQKLTDPEQISLMEKLLDIMDDDDDVQNVWHNWDED